MLSPRSLLLAAMLAHLSYEVCAMDCNIGGIVVSCPTILHDKNDIFCCSLNHGGCCDIGEYLQENTPILAGIIIAGVVVLILITVCCCCFCSCCCLAQRRMQRGTVLYG